MGEEQPPPPPHSMPSPPPLEEKDETLEPLLSSRHRCQFDPNRRIIRRKGLIKELAAVYHAECLSYCQELLELQKKWEESYPNIKTSENPRKGSARNVIRDPARHQF